MELDGQTVERCMKNTGKAVWISAALTAAFCSSAVAAEPGLGFQVEQYQVDLRPDLATTAISGRETIAIEAAESDLREIVFSPNALTISDAQLNGEAIPVRSDAAGITFVLPRPLAKGEKVSIVFQIQGVPARGVTKVPAGIYTGYFGCDWMVCLQDAPGDKAELQLNLFLPRGVKSLGVGRQETPIEISDDLVMYRWQSDLPTSPYLFAFAAGDFPEVRVDTPQGELLYMNGTGGKTDLTELFAQTPEMVAFFTDKAGMALPGSDYTQLLVPGRAAQETMSFSLVGKGELDIERENPSSAWVIGHELAHQWWGNLVTTETWQDFWLNEGFATFMVAAWKQHRFGEAAYQQELDVFRKRREQLREPGWDKPLSWSGAYPSLGYRRAVQYSKGALFLAELREDVGEVAFWSGVRTYTLENAGKAVTSRDFQRSIEQASKRDLAPLFDEWVFELEAEANEYGG